MVVVSLGLLGHDASSEPQVAPDVQGPQRLLAPERNADGLQGLPFTASRESRESGPRSRCPVSPGRPATGSKEGRWSPELRDCATQSVQRCGSTLETRGGRTVGREAPRRREPGTRRGATQRRRPEQPPCHACLHQLRAWKPQCARPCWLGRKASPHPRLATPQQLLGVASGLLGTVPS